MFVRHITPCMVVLCFVSLFVGLPFADAHPNTAEFDEVERNLDNAKAQQTTW